MRAIKKVVSALIITAISAGLFICGASAESGDVNVRNDCVYELQVLSELGILGSDAMQFDLNSGINRAQFAYVIAGFMGHKRNSQVDITNIDDVESEYMYADAINYITDNKIMSVDSENKFYPSQEITYKEAVSSIVAMLGYAPRAEVYGGKWTDFLRVARDIRVVSTYDDASKIKISYSEILKMLYDSLEIPLLEVTSVSQKDGESKFGYSNKSGTTPLDLWHNMYIIKGKLTNIEQGTTVLDNCEFPSDTARIDGYTFSVSQSEADAYIGYNVKAYYNKDTNYIKSIIPDVDENNVIRIEAKDIIRFSNNELYYDKNGRTLKVNIPASSGVVYNGVAVPSELRADVIVPNEGYVIINKFSGSPSEQLTMITEYKTYIVGAKSIDYVIYDKLTSGNGVSLDENGKSVKIFDEKGKPLSYDDIAEGDVLSLAVSLNNNRVRGMRSKDSVSGILTRRSNTDGKEYIYIDDKEYRMTESFVNSAKPIPQLGTAVTALIDSFGRAADINASNKSLFKYGFLKEAAVRDEGFTSELLVRIFDGSTVKTYSCDEKIIVDNLRTKTAKEALEALKKGQPAGLNRVYQPIRFRADDSGKVINIDTAYFNEAAGESEDSLRYIYRGNDPYNLGQGSALRLEAQSGYNFGQKFITYSSDLRYTIPISPKSDDEYYRGSISLWPKGYFIVDALTSRKDSLTAEFLVSYKHADSTTGVETKYGFVTDICEVLNSNQDAAYQISYIDSEGKTGSMTTRIKELIYEADSNEGKGVYEVSKGDFIRFERNGRDEISAIKMIYDAESQKWLNNTEYIGSFGEHIVNHGFVIQRSSGIVRVGYQKPKPGENIMSQASFYLNTAPTAVYMFDKEDKTVTKTTNSEILPYMQNGDVCSEIVSAGYNGVTRVLVIYK